MVLCRIEINYRKVEGESVFRGCDAQGEVVMMVANPKSSRNALQTMYKSEAMTTMWKNLGTTAMEELDHIIKSQLGIGGTVEYDIHFLSVAETINDDTARFVFYFEAT